MAEFDVVAFLEKQLNLPGGIWFSRMQAPPSLQLPGGKVELSKPAAFLFDGLGISGVGEEAIEKQLSKVSLTRFDFAPGTDGLKDATLIVGLELAKTWKLGQLLSAQIDISLANPGLVLTHASELTGWQADIYGELTLWGAAFDVAASWPDPVVSASYQGGQIKIANILKELHVPTDLVHGTISDVQLTVDTARHTQEVSIALDSFGIGGATAGLDKYFSFADTRIDVSHDADCKSAEVSSQLTVAGQKIDVSAAYEDGGFVFRATTIDADISIGAFAEHLTGGKVGLPKVVHDLHLTVIDVKLDTTQNAYSFECGATLGAEASDPQSGMHLGITFSVGGDDGGRDWSAYLQIGDSEFRIIRDSETDADGAKALDVFVANYANTSDTPLNLRDDLAAHATRDDEILQLVPPIDLRIKDVLFANVSEAQKDGDAGGNGDQSKSPHSSKVFGLAMDARFNLDLTGLPQVGSIMHAAGMDGTVGVKDFQVVMATAPVSGDGVNAVNNMLTKHGVEFQITQATKLDSDTQQKIAAGLGGGFAMSGKLGLGTETLDLFLGGGKQAAGDHASLPAKPGADEGKDPGPTKSTLPLPGPYADAHWFSIQKKLGPLFVHKLGLNFHKGELWVIPNADFSISGLTVSLEGFAISSPINRFSPSYHLQGLGIDYHKGPLEIGGAFLRVDGKDGDEFYGSVVAKTEALSLAALGSYATVGDAQSMFIYLDLDYPIGGPPFFFVTGLAAGFGYNRSLIVPPIEDLGIFPFVVTARSANQPKPKPKSKTKETIDAKSALGTVLEGMRTYVHPEVGQQWLAVGLHFTTFEIVKAFALLTVSFGHRFEIHVLGDATVSYPPDTTSPLTFVDILFDAKYLPEQGIVEVRAEIADGSYVFEPSCHLSGGLAMKTWFKEPNKDEFVFTLGGYHPKFKVPSFYPRVDRLAFNWQKSDALSIKGSMYFAMTGHALMAGGALDATWESGSLKAWLKIAADFLIIYKPFHYDASMSIDIGAQVTIHFFGTHHLSVHLGAHLHIWGPEFSGTASFDIWVASFSVSFGAGASAPPPLKWHEFRTTFLPASDDAMLTISVQDGMVKDLPGFAMDSKYLVSKTGLKDDHHWIINPKHLAIAISSVVPFAQSNFTAKNHRVRARAGIAPMDVRQSDFRTHLFVKLCRGEEGVPIDVSHADFNAAEAVKAMPAGLWGNDHKVDVNSHAVVPNVVSSFAFSPAPEGEPPPGMPVERSKLKYDTENLHKGYTWAASNKAARFIDDLVDTAAFSALADTTKRGDTLNAFFGAEAATKMSGALAREDVVLSGSHLRANQKGPA